MSSNQTLNDDEYKATFALITSIARTAQVLPMETLSKLLNTIGVMQGIAPILEPAAWMRGGGDNLNDQQEIAEAFVTFRKAIERVKERAVQRGRPVIDEI
jgi:hypothetical protein